MYSKLLTNIGYEFDTLARRYWHNGALYDKASDYRGNPRWGSDEYHPPVDPDGRFFDYAGVNRIQVERIIRRIATKEWKRPFIRIGRIYDGFESAPVGGYIWIKRRKSLESTIAPLVLAEGNGTRAGHGATYWQYSVDHDLWSAYLHHFLTDPELRRARGIPDDVPPLLDGVTE